MPSKNNIRRTPGNKDYGKDGQSDGFFRKAGDRLRGMGEAVQRFDEGINKRIEADNVKYAEDREKRLVAEGREGSMLGNLAGALRGIAQQPSFKKYTEDGQDVGNLAGYGVPAASFMAKYALPAGGVTLAGKGLIDIGTMLATPGMDEQQTSGTISP